MGIQVLPRKDYYLCSKEEEQWVIMIRDSLLRRSQPATCWPNSLSRAVFSLPGVNIQNVTKSLPSLFKSTESYPFLLINLGTNDTNSF